MDPRNMPIAKVDVASWKRQNEITVKKPVETLHRQGNADSCQFAFGGKHGHVGGGKDLSPGTLRLP